MTDVDARDESPRDPHGQGFSDAVTVSFGDEQANVYGIARVGLSGDGDGRAASGLAILFADGVPVTVRAAGGAEPAGPGWSDIDVAGVTHEVLDPMRHWRCAFEDEGGRHGFSLELEARSAPARSAPDAGAAAIGGMEGYEQLLEVRGRATIDGTERAIAGLGQRGHSWGAPDWSRMSVARTIGAWMPDGAGVTLSAVREEGVAGHGGEAIDAFLLADGAVAPVADPRLSTTYDGEGHQRQAGLELYVGEGEEEVAHRMAGEVVCGTTLDLGRLRLDCAFMRWRMEGRRGIGRYDVLRRVG